MALAADRRSVDRMHPCADPGRNPPAEAHSRHAPAAMRGAGRHAGGRHRNGHFLVCIAAVRCAWRRCRRAPRRCGIRCRRRRSFPGEPQAIEAPPSTQMNCPVTWRDAAEAKYTAAPLRSVSLPSRPRGVCAITEASIFSSKPRDIFDGKKPGHIALTRMPYGPHGQGARHMQRRGLGGVVAHRLHVHFGTQRGHRGDIDDVARSTRNEHHSQPFG